jgi:hypothetical protein
MHLLNRSTRQWVFGDPATQFIIPPGPSRVVEVPARLGPDDAKHAKHLKILDGYLKDPNSGLSELPASGSVALPPSVAAANAEEVTQLKEQIRKLQQLVSAGDGADAMKELQAQHAEAVAEASNLNAKLQGQLDDAQRVGSEAQGRIVELESILTSRNETITGQTARLQELEKQIGEALKQPKGRAKG